MDSREEKVRGLMPTRKHPRWCKDKPFSLPVALYFVPDGKGTMRIGKRGTSAGYTVMSFRNLQAAKKFMKNHPDARMPSWNRVTNEC